MNYFLDTDVCIYALKDEYPAIQKSTRSHSPDHIKISAIVKAELLLGAFKSRNPKKAFFMIEQFLGPFETIPFSDECAEIYAKIRAELEVQGKSIGANDLIIASTVLANHGTLVTHNMKEFSRVSQLKIQDWTMDEK